MGLFSRGGYRAAPPPTISRGQLMDPTQQSAMDEILGLAMGRLQDPLKGFEPMAERARSQFQTQTIPSLAERFTSMGEGAQRSSGFQQALGGAGVDLEEMLASLGSQYALQSVPAYSSLLGLGLQPKYENIMQGAMPKAPGMMASMLPMLAMGGMKALGGLF